MSLFSFGSDKSKSQYTSEQQSTASALDVALSRSNSASLSQGTSQSTSTQSLAFEDLLRSLYGGATDAATAQVAKAGLFENEANQLFTGGIGFLDQLQKLPGEDYQAGRLSGPDEAANAQIDVLGSSLGKFFNEQLMPGITSRGVSTGTLGGSRQGVAIGRAAGEVGQSYSQGVAQILSNSQAARDAIAGNLNTQKVGAASAGLGALPGVLGLAGAGFNAGLNPYLALSQIIGGPTVLTQQQSTSDQVAQAISDALSQSVGVSSSQSTARGQGTNNAKGYNFSVF